MDAAPLVELRCPNDGKLLLKASEAPGLVVEVRCSRCKNIVTAQLEPNQPEQ